MASRISYQKKANAEGIREETPASLKRRIKHVTGFKCKDIIPLEASSHVFTGPNGARYAFYTSIAFTVHGTGYDTDFNDVTRAPEYDNNQEQGEHDARQCYELTAQQAKKAEEANRAASNAAFEYDEPAAAKHAKQAKHHANRAARHAKQAAQAAFVAGTPTASTYADAAAEEAARAREFANDAAYTAAHIYPEPETIEPEPEQDEPEPSEKAAKDAREYASMCAFISMSCALASIRAILDNDVSGAEHAARAAQNNADRAADAARHANESAPDSMTARSALEYAAHAQTGADIAARVIHDLTRPSVEDLAAKYDNPYLIWSE